MVLVIISDTLFIEITTTKNVRFRHVRLKIISHEKKVRFLNGC